MSRSSGWTRTLVSAARYPFVRLSGYPLLVNLEVTRRCNARCDFCRYWHIQHEPSLDDYVDVVRALHPVAVMFTGGEPLLRRDLEQLVARVRERCPFVYLGMVTNGALLTVERGLALWRAGLDQLGISLDFPDERHDAARGIPRLAARIRDVAPRLAAAGVQVVTQTVIKSDNLDCVLEVVHWAIANGLKVGISAYTAVKADNHDHDVGLHQREALRAIVDELLRLKRQTSAIASSSYYLRRIPEVLRLRRDHGVPGGARVPHRQPRRRNPALQRVTRGVPVAGVAARPVRSDRLSRVLDELPRRVSSAHRLGANPAGRPRVSPAPADSSAHRSSGGAGRSGVTIGTAHGARLELS